MASLWLRGSVMLKRTLAALCLSFFSATGNLIPTGVRAGQMTS